MTAADHNDQRAADALPPEINVKVQFAGRFEAVGEFERALEEMEAAVQVARQTGLSGPSLARLLASEARLGRRAGRLIEAASWYHEAVTLMPAERPWWLALAATYRDARLWSNAETVFLKILDDHPGDRPALYGLTETLGLAGNPEGCAETFMRIDEPAGGEAFLAARVWFQRAMLYLGRDAELSAFLNERQRSNENSFVHPSWEQDLTARPRTPSLFLISLKRSGSVYVWRKLADGCGMPMVRLACGDFFETLLIEENLRLFASHGMVSQEHLAPLPNVLDALEQFAVRPVVHLRDPRQSMISWLHYVDREVAAVGGDAFYLDIPGEWAEMAFEAKADWCIEHYMPRIIAWVEGWASAAASRPQLDILFTHFEEMKTDESGFFKRILDHAGLPHGSFNDITMEEAEMLASANFHRGETNEWQRLLSNGQKARLVQLLPGELADRFGWDLS